MARNHVTFIKGADTVARPDSQLDQNAQEEAKASATPKSANEHLLRNTTGYVDGDGSGAKGQVDTPEQKALLDVGDPQYAEDAEKQAQQQKDADEGKGVEEPGSAPDQVKAHGEAQQRAVEEQKKREEEAQKEAEKAKEQEQKKVEEKADEETETQVDKFTAPASSQEQGGKEVSSTRTTKVPKKDK